MQYKSLTFGLNFCSVCHKIDKPDVPCPDRGKYWDLDWGCHFTSAVFEGLSVSTSCEAVDLKKELGLSIYRMKIYIASDCSGLD